MKNSNQRQDKLIILKHTASGVIALGSGLAMMPIFNKNITDMSKYGLDIHANTGIFVASTINTLLTMTSYSAFVMYHYFSAPSLDKEELTKTQQAAMKLALPAAVGYAGVPLALLWDVELNNQQVEGSEGFDKFVAWASFASLPLIIFKTAETYQLLNRAITNKSSNFTLDNVGAKVFTYGVSSIATAARIIAYAKIIKDFLHNVIEDEGVLTTISVIGGLAAASIVGVSEYTNIKTLFKTTEEASKLQLLKGVFASVQGAWFALPVISKGLDAMEDYSPLIKGALFVPLFVSKAIHESSNLFNFLTTEIYDWEQEAIGENIEFIMQIE